MTQPFETGKQSCSLITLFAYAIAVVLMVLLIRWSWEQWNWIGVGVAIASPVIGLIAGAVSIILFAWLFAAFAWIVSPEFRGELRDARTAEAKDAKDKAFGPDQIDSPS